MPNCCSRTRARSSRRRSRSTTEPPETPLPMQPPPLDAPGDRIAFNLRGWNPRPAFLVGPGWLPHIFSIRMEPHWHRIDAGGRCQDYLGTNYLLFPTPTAGRPWTAHFEPTSPY